MQPALIFLYRIKTSENQLFGLCTWAKTASQECLFQTSKGFRNQEWSKNNLRWINSRIFEGLSLLLFIFSWLKYVCIYDTPQDSHQLSTSESGCSGYAVRDLYNPQHFPRAHFHPHRWDGWCSFMQIDDGWRLGMDCWNFLGSHFDCNCCWTIFCGKLSCW